MTSAKHVMPLLRVVADAAFPPRCSSCREIVTADGNFCSECFAKVRMIASPMCACCGIPFVVAMEAEGRCPECLDTPPQFDMARAVMVYDGISAPLVTALKFHDQWAGLERYVTMMVGSGQVAIQGVDLIIPVPLHWRRLWGRRYNQSALLAFGIAARVGLPCTPAFLKRVVRTKPQMRLDRAERARNVKHAFAVPDMARDSIAGKTILLVDDVVTTGATANAFARVLKAAGAKEVRVLALARTVKE